MNEVDLWDDAGPFLYRHMPEGSLSAFFTEERDMIQITRESDGWWLSETGTQGASRYDTLEAAKAAGDEAIAEAEAALDGRLLAEAGLDPESWTVRYDDGIQFESRVGGLWIAADADGMSSRQSWSLHDGDDAVLEGCPSIALAVEAAKARMPTRPE
jgi:hypothetical protein